MIQYSHLPHRRYRTPMARLLIAISLLLAVMHASAEPISFRKQIAPIFATACNACHGGASPQSALTLTSYAALMKGGRRGRAIMPGNPKASLLVQYIEGVKQPRMPIGG